MTALEELESVLKQLNSTTSGRRAFLAAVPLLLAACATPAKHRYREGDNTGQETDLSVEDEKRMTAEILPSMRKDYPPVKDPKVQAYISDLGQSIVHANRLDGRPYKYEFAVVDVSYVNAFALPAGTVFVTAPLIQLAESEAELAGVVGHEIGHITARHTAERIDRAKKERNKTIFSGIGGGLLGGAVGFGLGKLLCPPKDKACLAKAAGAGAAAGVGAGLLIRKYAFMAHSREDEMEADRIGFRTSVAAGYSKDHVGLFYEKLLEMEKKSKKNNAPVLASLADAMSTHPPSQERVNQMKEMQRQEVQTDGKLTSRDFENTKDRLSTSNKKK